MLRLIAFDADDTLWHTERYYQDVQAVFADLVAPFQPNREAALAALYAVEMNNLASFGYGVKGFALSLLQTALEISGGQIAGRDLQKIIEIAREMVTRKVELIDGAAQTVAETAQICPLMLLTKGDLMDQERKIAQSGLAPFFAHVEIVSSKTPATYAAIFQKYQLTPAEFLMVGNSRRSDVLPVVALGGYGVHVPYAVTWAHEAVDEAPADPTRYFELERIALLPQLIRGRLHQ